LRDVFADVREGAIVRIALRLHQTPAGLEVRLFVLPVLRAGFIPSATLWLVSPTL
jgi:zinc transporter ZupT